MGPAFLLGPFWFLYRELYRGAAGIIAGIVFIGRIIVSGGDRLPASLALVDFTLSFRFAGGPLGKNPLQGAAMHAKAAGCFRDIAVALFKDALNMLPADTVGRHGIFRRWREGIPFASN